MAYQVPGFVTGTVTAAADLSAKQYYIVKVTANNAVNLTSSAGEAAFGILQNAPTSGAAAAVMNVGVSLVIAGSGGLAAGNLVQAAADGTAIAASTGDYVLGTVIVGASAGEYATIFVNAANGQNN